MAGQRAPMKSRLGMRVKQAVKSKEGTSLWPEVVDVNDLPMDARKTMFALFERYYENVTYSRFLTDLEAKDIVVLARRPGAEIAGFSTASFHLLDIDGERIRYMFSGDTVADSAYWGDPVFIKAFFQEAGRRKARHPQQRLFWFSIFNGHRTFRVLPNFFRVFVPSHGDEPNGELVSIRNAIARDRYGAQFDEATGLVDFGRSLGNLRSEWALLDETAQRSRYAALFRSLNPDAERGVELACLAEFDLANLKRYAAPIFAEGLRDIA